ncbi:MAG: hypothetical protein KA715_11730 [Xanthomonadaceae bacterium]|nr:hypothetical protein [Xanthomonadaceae bacterium]
MTFIFLVYITATSFAQAQEGDFICNAICVRSDVYLSSKTTPVSGWSASSDDEAYTEMKSNCPHGLLVISIDRSSNVIVRRSHWKYSHARTLDIVGATPKNSCDPVRMNNELSNGIRYIGNERVGG